MSGGVAVFLKNGGWIAFFSLPWHNKLESSWNPDHKKEARSMRQTFLIMAVLFGLLTFAGAGYVLSHMGRVSPGCALIPMIFTLIFAQAYRSVKK